jgi:hypothetical protein
MADRVSLEYHRKTFALLNEEPALSVSNLRKIERWEDRHGMRLPGAVREWYSLEGCEERLRVEDAEDFSPLGLQKALNRLGKAYQAGAGTNRLELGSWEPGAVSYARFDGTQDPVVDLGWDEGGEVERFSAFAFCRAWSRRTHSNELGDTEIWGNSEFPLLQADEPTFSRADMAYLAERFSEGVHTLVAGRWREGRNPRTGQRLRLFAPVSVVRFFSRAVRVGVVCRGNPSRRRTEAHWDVSADSEKELVDAVAQHLWRQGSLAHTLTSPTKAGKAALRKLRRRFRGS